jgi:hypothetical protein
MIDIRGGVGFAPIGEVVVAVVVSVITGSHHAFSFGAYTERVGEISSRAIIATASAIRRCAEVHLTPIREIDVAVCEARVADHRAHGALGQGHAHTRRVGAGCLIAIVRAGSTMSRIEVDIGFTTIFRGGVTIFKSCVAGANQARASRTYGRCVGITRPGAVGFTSAAMAHVRIMIHLAAVHDVVVAVTKARIANAMIGAIYLLTGTLRVALARVVQVRVAAALFRVAEIFRARVFIIAIRG